MVRLGGAFSVPFVGNGNAEANKQLHAARWGVCRHRHLGLLH
jgi:hypothetical protein